MGLVGAVVCPAAASVMVLGGQVAKKPAELDDWEIVALISAEPG
jgi:hypothetical protein